jgi:hypothetical protein
MKSFSEEMAVSFWQPFFLPAGISRLREPCVLNDIYYFIAGAKNIS